MRIPLFCILFEICFLFSIFPFAVKAQIVPDNTLPERSEVIQENGILRIEGGSQFGENLFHSFHDFSVPDSQTAYFNNSRNVQAIFSRVTSGSVSQIDGTIKSNGSTDLFFINPSGIIFGPNSSLDIGGSFLASTASSVTFADGKNFSANSPTQSLLTVSTPIGLQFGQSPGAIRHESTANLVSNNFGVPIGGGLEVSQGKTLALIGGSIDVEGGLIFADRGNIELGSIAQNEQVQIVPSNQGWVVDFAETNSFQNIRLSDLAFVSASEGNIQIRGKNISLKDDAEIVSTTESRKGGNVFLGASQTLTMSGNNTRLATQSNGEGDAGDLTIQAKQVFIKQGAFVETPVSSSGRGGNLIVKASELVELSGTTSDGELPSGLFAEVNGMGNGGTLSIKSKKIRILDGAQASVVNFGFGDAGKLIVEATDSVEIIEAKQPIGNFPTGLFAQVENQGDGGEISINTRQFILLNGSQVSTEVFGAGKGGDINLVALDSTELTGTLQRENGEFSSGLFALVAGNGTGDAGDILVKTQNLLALDGAQISTSSRNIGTGGSLSISADFVFLSGASTISGPDLSSGIFTSAEPGAIKDVGKLQIRARILTIENLAQISANNSGTGSGGILTIDVDTLNIRDGGRVRAASLVTNNATTNNRGPGGTLTINASNSVNISGSTTFADQIINSTLSTEAQGTGKAGNLLVNTNQLVVSNSGEISASTLDIGDAGTVTINSADLVSLSGDNSGIFASTTGQGRGGDITVSTNQFRIQDHAVIDARTTDEGTGGSIFINSNRFEATNNGQLLTTTEGRQRAGDITLEVRDDLTLEGQGSGLFANTGPNSSGPGGNIIIDPPTVNIRNGAGIAVDSQGSGIGGNISLEAGRLNLSNQAFISAETLNNQGGNIRLNIADLLLLQGSSTVSATAGRDQNSGDGGNIDINAPLIVAFPNENSDITANAFSGRGGNVTINTQGLFGLQARDELTPLSDITASSELGFSGNVTINTPETDPDRALVDLPVDIVRPQLTQRCSPGAPVASSSFFNSGRGGLPPSPEVPSDSETVWEDLRSPPRSQAIEKATQPVAPAQPTKIIEAQGWRRTATGHIQLVAQGISPPIPQENLSACIQDN